MWVTYLHEFDRRPKQFIYFSSFYVSPVVEARDVVSLQDYVLKKVSIFFSGVRTEKTRRRAVDLASTSSNVFSYSDVSS